MILALALAAASAQPVDQAERAFAAMAQTKGQWAAFRATAAPDAIMLAPGVVRAHDLLPKLKEPPVAVMWWPARTVTSCDGSLAFSTGPWRRDGGRASGRYLTVWQRQTDGQWKWIYDGGSDAAPMPAGDRVQATFANCRKPSGAAPVAGSLAGSASRDGTLRWRLDPADGGKFRLRVDYAHGGAWAVAEDAIVG